MVVQIASLTRLWDFCFSGEGETGLPLGLPQRRWVGDERPM